MLRRIVIALLVAALAGCAGAQHSLPAAPSSPQGATLTPQDSVGEVPADSVGEVPADSVGEVPAGVLACGLSLYTDMANCTIAVNIVIPSISSATTPASLLPGLHPADLQSAYALPSQNAGGTVAIVDAYDDPAAELDLAVYRAAYGLPACTSLTGCFRKVNQQGQNSALPAADLAWSQESSLDLDVVSAVCPKCKILLVEANSNSLNDLAAAVDTAARMGAVAISNSYYAAESSGETAYDSHFHHPGVAITVAAGDAAKPFYPAASPYVTAVGGTTLSGGSGSWSESPWANGGQGCSKYEIKPDWQGNNSCQGKRATVDVAAVADPRTGVSMFDSTAGGWLVAGGTSVGAPLVAAAYALSGNAQGPADSYAHAAAFHDVLPAGYDWPTGLGSPNGVGGL